MNAQKSVRPKASGVEIFVALAGVFLAQGHLVNLYTSLFQGTIAVRMEREDPQASTSIDGVELPIDGIFSATLSLADLSPAPTAFLVASSAVFAAGLLTATWFFSTALTSISGGREHTSRVLKYLWITLFVLVGTFALGGLTHMIGILGVELDLDINIENGYDLTSILVAIGILGIISALIAAVKRSERAEADTEGLV